MEDKLIRRVLYQLVTNPPHLGLFQGQGSQHFHYLQTQQSQKNTAKCFGPEKLRNKPSLQNDGADARASRTHSGDF